MLGKGKVVMQFILDKGKVVTMLCWVKVKWLCSLC